MKPNDTQNRTERRPFASEVTAFVMTALMLGGGVWMMRARDNQSRELASKSDPGRNPVVEKSMIRVRTATWAGKDVTALAAKHCDGTVMCDYKIAEKFIGAPANAKDKSFAIAWTCGDAARTHEKRIAHDATDRHLYVDCYEADGAKKQ